MSPVAESSRPRWWAMLVVLTGIALAVLDGSILNLALPEIARQLQVHEADAIWLVNGYQLTSLVFLLPLASWGDRIGFRKVYLVGMAVFLVASVMASMASSLPVLVAARVLQGLGAAGTMGVNAALIRLIYPPNWLGRGIAINSVTVAVASVAGPSLAALILSQGSWRWLFVVNIPLAVLALTLGYVQLPLNAAKARTSSQAQRPSTFGWPDVVLNGLTFSLIFIGADGLGESQRGAAASTTPWAAWATLLVGLLIGAVYWQRQRRQDLPLLAVDLLRLPVFALSMGTSVMAFSAHTLAFVALPFLLIDHQGLSASHAGWLITMWPLATAVTAPLAGRLIGRIPDGLLGGVGLTLMGSGLLLLALLPGSLGSDWGVASCLLLSGAGFGLFQSPNNHTIISTPPAHRSGAAGGMLATARLTGQSIGAVLLALLFSFLASHSTAGSGAAPLAALALGGSLSLLGAVFSTLRVKQPGGGVHRPPQRVD